MNTFTQLNISRWDRVVRLAIATALLAPVFVTGNSALFWLALLAPYFGATAMIKWDPLYGLINMVLTLFSRSVGPVAQGSA